MILVYIVFGSQDEAQNIAKKLLKDRLIACANIYSTESIYAWENELKITPEWVLMAKTLRRHYKEIEQAVSGVHSYKVPAIFSLKVNAVSQSYRRWVKKQVK